MISLKTAMEGLNVGPVGKAGKALRKRSVPVSKSIPGMIMGG
jgi:hypothetical protein